MLDFTLTLSLPDLVFLVIIILIGWEAIEHGLLT